MRNAEKLCHRRCLSCLCSLQARLGWGDHLVLNHVAETRLRILPLPRTLSFAEANCALDPFGVSLLLASLLFVPVLFRFSFLVGRLCVVT